MLFFAKILLLNEQQIHVAYLSYDGMTDPLGQSQVLPYLKGLSGAGYTIHLISFEKPERFETGRELVEQVVAESSLFWYPLPYTRKPPVLSTLKDVLALTGKLNEICKKYPIRLVHCRSYITALTGLRFKRRKSLGFLFDMRGFYADERVDGGLWNLQNPIYKNIYRFFKRKEKAFIRESDAVVSLTYAGKKEILSWRPPLCKEEHITVIPCCADLSHFDFRRVSAKQSKETRASKGYGESEKILVYLGSLGTWYMVNEMMSLFVALHSRDKCWRFLLLTTDEPHLAYRAAEAKGVAKKLIRVESAARRNLPELLSIASFSVFFIKPAYSKLASSPTKLAELLGMGIPVVCNEGVGDVADIINRGNAGIVVQNFTPEALHEAAKGVSAFASEKQKLRDYAFTYADLNEGIARYREVYRSILQS